MKKLLALALVLVMMASAAVAEVNAAGKGDWDELTTITLYSNTANLQSGVQGGYWGDIAKWYGLSIDVWAYSDDKTNAIMASKSLPDVMVVTKENLAILIENNLIIDFDEYMDQLPNLEPFNDLQIAMNFSRQFRSNDTGKLYGIPVGVSGGWDSKGITKNMIAVNWNYYYQLGCPEVTSEEELIDLMVEMQETFPEGPDGIQNWGTYLNAGGDTKYWASITEYFKWHGHEVTSLEYLIDTDMYHGTYSSILEEDGLYKAGLKWYNAAMRAGVVEPDSMYKDRQTQKALVDNGYAMVCSGTIQGYSKYMPLYIEGQELVEEGAPNPYGGNNYLVVSASTENLDAALRFVNMMADTDAQMVSIDGPEGECWYLGDDGKAYIKDETVETYAKGEPWVLSDGQQLALWYVPFVVDSGRHFTTLEDPDGGYRPIRFDEWSEIMAIRYDTEQWNQWREATGCEDFYDMAGENLIAVSVLNGVTNFVTTPDDMLQLKIDAIKNVVVNASWQMVYAESDEKFEEIWSNMVAECNGLGADEVIEWALQDLENATAIRDSLN